MEIPEFRIEDFKIDDDFEREGGQAKVSKGFHSTHGDVAIKEWFSASDNMKKEVELLRKNTYHQNIIQVLGVFINKKAKCVGYVTPYMSMGTLKDIIHNKYKQYDQKQIKSWITQICCGLSYLHDKQIIHRDIKPSNVLLGKCYDDVKLSDFGTARSLNNITNTLTKERGTVLYMAPEMFKGGEYDFSVDIYSLSITIWEILHRRIPYDHITHKFDLPNKICNGERPQLNINLSAEVFYLLAKCWNTDASKRPTTDYVREFCSKATFSLMDLKNSVNECTTSFESLDANNVESTNVHNNITAESREALNDDEPLSRIPVEKPNENFPISNSIEENPEKQTILLLGGIDGMNDDSLLILENNGQNWKQLNIKLPYAMYGHGAQFLNNNLYIFGGYNENHKYLNWTYKLSKSLYWKKMAYMNQKRWGISNSSVILNNQIWVCGGGHSSVEVYDPETNKWKYVKDMNRYRQLAAAAVANGKIFCSGGEDGQGGLNSAEYYDPSSDVWTSVCNMPQSIQGHGAVEINGNLIVLGGYSYGECLNDVIPITLTRGRYSISHQMSYDDKNAVWIEKPSMSTPSSYFSIAKIDRKIFICGGAVIGDNLWAINDDVKIFDGEVWRDGPKMPTPRLVAAAVVIPMEFAKQLIKDNIIISEDLNVPNNNNNNESLAQISFEKPNENFHIPNSSEEKPDKQTILLLGDDGLLMLENNQQNWKQLDLKLPYPMGSHGAQFLNNLYIFGGYNEEEGVLNSTYKLSKMSQWEKMADMNQKRYALSNSNVILNNQIWVCGGRDEVFDPLRSVEMYDPLTNKWKYMKEMNQCQPEAAAAVVNGKIFSCGGNHWSKPLNSVECYDPSSDVWTLICNMPRAIEEYCAGEIDGHFVVMGGLSEGRFLGNVWALDTTDKNAKWIEKAPMYFPRRYFSIAKIDDKIFACGGHSACDNVEIFDGKVWRNGPKMPVPRFRAAAIAISMEFAQYLK